MRKRRKSCTRGAASVMPAAQTEATARIGAGYGEGDSRILAGSEGVQGLASPFIS